MNKTLNEKRIAETVRLYEVEELSMKRIAERLNITRQAVLYRLKNAGVEFRPKRHDVVTTLKRDDLNRLYVDDGLSVAAVARALNVDSKIVVREMERFSIERRPKYFEKRKSTPLDSLKIDECAVIPFRSPQFISIRKMAAVRNIKIKVKRIDPDHVRVTRICPEIPSPLDRLQVGDIMVIKIESANANYTYLYDRAIARGIKASIRRLDEHAVKLTRIE